MTINTSIPKQLKPYFQAELVAYKSAFERGDLAEEWRHLEYAHIIGQRYPLAHTEVHWKMLRFGIHIKNSREIFGQIPRLLIGGVKSFVGKIPTGNPGGANVPPLQSFPISPEIQAIFEKAGVN